jgi:hypothetical protein
LNTKTKYSLFLALLSFLALLFLSQELANSLEPIPFALNEPSSIIHRHLLSCALLLLVCFGRLVIVEVKAVFVVSRNE